MYRGARFALVTVLLLGAAACGGRRQPVENVRVPPRIDLKQHEMIGVVEFASTSDGELSSLATRRFTEMARRDQGLVRMLDFGTQSEALRSVGRQQWDAEAVKDLGREHGVETILAGAITVSDVRPDFSLSATLRSGQVSAWVDATLDVELIETATGASLWSSSASATRNVGQISVLRGKQVTFDAEDPENAYGDLVNALVEVVTRDFRATWERR